MVRIDDPDAWWDTLSADRKAQIARWISGGHEPPPEVDGQLSIDDVMAGTP